MTDTINEFILEKESYIQGLLYVDEIGSDYALAKIKAQKNTDKKFIF